MRRGTDGFVAWAENNLKKYPLYEKVIRYERYIQMTEKLKKKQPVFFLNDKMEKLLKETGGQRYLQETAAAFPYALPDFGRTKETILLGIAKDGSERGKKFAEQLVNAFIPTLVEYISWRNIDAVAFVPPSARRRIQIMKILTDRLTAQLPDVPVILIKKKHKEIIIQQKHLSTARERIRNADATFTVPPTEKRCNRLLLIDDMVGSGATLNSVAKKITEQGIAKEIYGIAMIGDEKGFSAVKKM